MSAWKGEGRRREGEGGGTWGGEVGKGDESRGGRRAERGKEGEKREEGKKAAVSGVGEGRSVGWGRRRRRKVLEVMI